MKRLILLLGLLLSTNLYAQQDLAVFLRDLSTLQADFVQRLYADTGELLEETEGQMYIQRPDYFRWAYQVPYQQLIVADGKLVWIYDEDLEQVTIKDFDTALGKTPALLLSSSQPRVEQDFNVSKLDSQSEYTRLQLEPKEEDAPFEKIILTLNGQALRGLDLVDNLGQTTTMHFKNMQRNQKLDKALFQFVPPEHVDIIDESE
ncbi:outer membrane lipoprotein chaperone LolA [Candidatus Albibeggiatoa sp. nov. NOAA]|uniref:outer membrane lipoprotein chaperone LolA n=1 Tax=Candidatus Albibeggiatoa sp. nov. NOAA TaxID=3162724 RepID=UPI0032F79BB0|nr:outer membrane lipoprotein chaperone LolA [Thiotrichaceae bacterium]